MVEDGYLFTGKLRLVPDLTQERKSLEVKNKSQLSIEALGETDLSGNIIIDQGSKVSIISKFPVSLKGVEVKSGGCLEIKSGSSIILDKNTKIEKGTTLMITKGN